MGILKLYQISYPVVYCENRSSHTLDYITLPDITLAGYMQAYCKGSCLLYDFSCIYTLNKILVTVTGWIAISTTVSRNRVLRVDCSESLIMVTLTLMTNLACLVSDFSVPCMMHAYTLFQKKRSMECCVSFWEECR